MSRTSLNVTWTMRVSCMLIISYTDICCAQQSTLEEHERLTPDEERIIRELTYSHVLLLVSVPNGDAVIERRLNVPIAVHSLYGTKPEATLRCLVEIARGGRPADSMNAVAFALSVGRKSSPPYSLLRSYHEYDRVDDKLKETRRSYWVRAVTNRLEDEMKPHVDSARPDSP